MPLPSSGIIVVEKSSRSINATETAVVQNQIKKQSEHLEKNSPEVQAQAKKRSVVQIAASPSLPTLLKPSKSATTLLSTTKQYSQHNDSNNVRIQQHQQDQEHHQPTELQFQFQQSSTYAKQQQNAFVEQINNHSSNGCKNSDGAVSTTALKRRQNINFNKSISSSRSCSDSYEKNNFNNFESNKNTGINHSSKTGASNNAIALKAASSGIHQIYLNTREAVNLASEQKYKPLTQNIQKSLSPALSPTSTWTSAPVQHIEVNSEELSDHSVRSGCNVIKAVNGSKSNMILSTTSEMINQQQVYKIVAADGTTSNMIIDNLGNVTPTGGGGGGGGGVAVSSGSNIINNTATIAASGGNTSKVLLGNLTVLSKHHHMNNAVTTATAISTSSISSISCSATASGQQQQQHPQHPQTINFVSAKNLSYLATVASVSGTGSTNSSQAITSYGSISANANSKQKFALSSSPYKNSNKQHQQTASTGTTFLLQQPQQKLSTSGPTATMPLSVTTRPVQMMTRVQALVQPSSSVAGTSVLQQQPQILLHSQAKHIMPSNKLHNSNTNNSTNNSLVNSGANFKKASIVSSSVKIPAANKISTLTAGSSVVQHHNVATAGLGVKTTFIPQQQQQHQHFQTSNNIVGSGANTGGIGMGSGTISKAKSSSKLIKQYNNAINNSASSLSTYTINQQKFNNNSSQQQQNASATVSSTTKITKLSNKYILHQPQSQAQQAHTSHLQQHIVNLPHGTQLQHKGVLPTSSSPVVSQNHFNPSSASISSGATSTTTIYQHLSSTGNASGGVPVVSSGSSNSATITPTGTIKFVNAHGTVIQQHPSTQAIALHSHTGSAAVTTTTATAAALSATTIAPSTASLTSSASSTSANTTSLFADDIVIVNGTQMTDELSARILQSMSQKSFSNSQHRYQQQLKLSTVAGPGSGNCGTSSNQNNAGNNMPPPTTHQQQQIPNILLASKDYQLYNPVQSTTGAGVAISQQSSLLPPSVASTSCLSAPVSTFLQQHNTVVPSAPSSYLTPGSSGNLGPVPMSPVSISYMTTSSSLATAVPSASNSRQVYSAPGNRSHSTERKFSDNSITRKNLEAYKLSNNGMAGNTVRGATTSGSVNPTSAAPMEQQSFQHVIPQQHPHTQVIHLQTLKTSSSSTNLSSSLLYQAAVSVQPNSGTTNDDDIIGEEIRPVPVITQDVRLQILHAVVQDHTYANAMPTRLPTDFNIQQMLLHQQQQSGVAGISTGTSGGSNTNLLTSAVGSNGSSNASQYVATSVSSNISASSTAAVTSTQSWSVGGVPSSVATMSNSQQLVHSSYTTMYGQSIPRLQQQDDDAHSAISNGSRAALGDIDPGEETETAPEAEAEDDSITRCICDFTHDDGYMICCDKCSAWQHVDCMVVDRSNIPDEYLCELCQPRPVNKSRARALQILKRKQQSQAVITVQTNSSGNSVLGGVLAGVGLLSKEAYMNAQRFGGNTTSSSAGSNSNLSNLIGNDGALHTLSNAALGIGSSSAYLSGNSYTTKKSKFLKKTKDLAVGAGNLTASGRKSKKSEKPSTATAAVSASSSACAATISNSATSSKTLRKETRKSTKRKTKASVSSSDPSGGGGPGSNTAAGKHAANLRHWIENYELAVTNHYSPELRARLHAITKQPSLLQSIINTENKALKDCGNLENRATTVPHAGGKILISNLEIGPNYPIFELRGKYMLTTQYKTQNPSVNMNMPPPSNYQLIASHKAHKTPGPFIFFYQLPGAEAPMQTRNPDGSYPPVPPQPAYLKGPEICVDTRTYGNEARFVRRSCRPNAEIQHLFEKGTIHLFLVSLTTIRASTEITIRHEPHDILAVESRKSNALIVKPTSTACACGLTNDCLFGPPLPKLPASAAKPGRKSAQLRSDKKAFQSSAALQLTSSAATCVGSGQIGNVGKKKSSQTLNRNRSTSSSGDSNMGGGAGFQSPNITQMHLGGTIMVGGAASNANLKTMSLTSIAPNNNILALSGCGNSTSSMHDSGICTSSSSPSVSIPSPTPQHIHSPTQQQQTTVLQRTLIMQQQNPQHQQMLAALPASMLLSPQLHHHQQQPQTQQPLAVIAAAAVAQLPMELPNRENINNDNNSLNNEQQSSTSQLLQYPELSLSTQQHSNVDKTLAAAAALQSLNSSANSADLDKTNAPEMQYTKQKEQESIVSAKTSVNEQSEISDFSSPQITQKRQRNSSGSAYQRLMHSKSSQEASVSVQAKDASENLTDSITTSTSTPLKVAQKQQQHVPSSRKATSGTKNKNSSETITNASSGSDSYHQYKTAETTSDITSVSATTSLSTQSSSSATTTALTSTPNEKPKLSREDRKMEAILRAIEKMERTQQRKKESKASKGSTKRRQNEVEKRSATNTSGEFVDTPNISNSSGVGQSVKRVSHVTRKKKRKANKSYGSGNGMQRKRHKSRVSSNDSDADGDADCAAVTSESEGASLLSPNLTVNNRNISKSSSIAETGMTSDSQQHHQNEDQAAGLLMSLASHSVEKKSTLKEACFTSPQRASAESVNVTSTPHSASRDVTSSPPATPAPGPISSACLLIEAAVAPLDGVVGGSSEFKYPSKAKTKKSLMSNWLHQSEAEASQHVNTTDSNESSVGLNSLVQAAMCDFEHGDEVKQQTDTSVSEDDGLQKLSVVALKVEEFIYQTEGSSSPVGEIVQKNVPQHQLSSMYEVDGTSIDQQQHTVLGNNLTASDHSDLILNSVAMPSTAVRNLHLPLHQVSTCSNNSSVKKRWLRQAISEETDDTSVASSPVNALTPQSASPAGACGLIMPNGFTTPLKKRRLVINNKNEELESEGGSSGNTIEQNNELVTPTSAYEQEEIVREAEESQKSIIRSSEKAVSHVKSDEELNIEDDYKIEHAVETESEIVDVVSEHYRTHIGFTEENISVSQPQPRTKAASKQFVDAAVLDAPKQETKPDLSHFTDQDDDVDILRSPSPGPKIVAEDNLVKIEPEDVSGGDDVKIDVEREESLATDNFEEMVSGMKTKEEDDIMQESKSATVKKENIKLELADIDKYEGQSEPSCNDNRDNKYRGSQSNASQSNDVIIKDMKNPIKYEKSGQKHKGSKKSKLHIEVQNKDDEPLEKKPKLYDNVSPYMCQDVSQTVTNSYINNNLLSKQQLSVDDIQDRISLFHQENILLLQARNKQQSIDATVTSSSGDAGNATVQRPVTPDYNKFELDTVKPSPPSPSLYHHPYNELLPITTPSVGKTVTSSSKHLSKQSSSSTHHVSSSSKKSHKRDRERDRERERERDRDRDRERDRDHRDRERGRERSRQRERGRQRERNRSYDRSRDRERGRSYNRSYDRDRDRERDRVSRDRSYDRHRSRDRSYDYSHDHSRDRSYEHNRSRDHSRERSRERGSNSYYYNNKTSTTNTSTSHNSSSNHNSYTGHYNSNSTTTYSTPTAASYAGGKKGAQLCSSSKSSKKILSSSTSNASGAVNSGLTEKGRYRTTSSSSTNVPGNISAGTAQTSSVGSLSGPSSTCNNKKRLNFEQENMQSSGKYQRREDRNRDFKDEQSNIIPTTGSTTKRRLRDDESRHPSFTLQRSLSSSAGSVPVSALCNSMSITPTNSSCSPVYSIPVINSGTVSSIIPLVEPMQAQQLTSVHVTYPPPQPLRIVREHPTIPHFNNPLTVMSAEQDVLTSSSKTSNCGDNLVTTSASSFSLTNSSLGSSANCESSVSSLENHAAAKPVQLSSTSSFSSSLNNHSTTVSNQLPFYNTVYGKLHMTSTGMLPTASVSVPTQSTTTSLVNEESLTQSSASQQNTGNNSVVINTVCGGNMEQGTSGSTIIPIPPVGKSSSGSDVGMSNYLDAKLKSYSSLSGYVSHSALFGLGNTSKLGSSSSGTIGGHAAAGFSVGGITDATNLNSLDGIISSSTSTTLGKLSMLTKTASHDPRLNPILSAPEPPTVPKRKLSINEYRRRMKQSSSSSIESSNSVVTTPTTPEVPLSTSNSATLLTTSSTFPTSSSFFEDAGVYSKETTEATIATVSTPAINSRCASNSSERSESGSGTAAHRNTLTSKSSEKTSSLTPKCVIGGLYSGIDSPPSLRRTSIDEELKNGQFNAAPTLLEKQQEKLCERLKSLKNQQSILKANQGNIQECSKLSSSSSSFLVDRTLSLPLPHVNNSDVANNMLENCFEAISSTSTSMESSLNSSPEHSFAITKSDENQKDDMNNRKQQQEKPSSVISTESPAITSLSTAFEVEKTEKDTKTPNTNNTTTNQQQ